MPEHAVAPLVPESLVAERAKQHLPQDFPVRDLDAYTRFAWQRHPDMRVAQAACALAKAEAGVALRPPPLDLELGVERRNPGGGSGIQPGGGIGLGYWFESPDRRRLRTERARALSMQQCLEVPATAWTLRQGLHTAWLSLQGDYARRRLMQRRAALLDQLVARLTARVEAGQDDAFALAVARLEHAELKLALAENAATLASARSQFVATLGLPGDALDGHDLALPELFEPPVLAGLPAELIRMSVLTSRADLRALLSAYLVSEADVQIAQGRAWPDIRLSPAVVFDQGQLVWQLASQLVLPLAREREPALKAALAGRELAAQRFRAVQHRILGELEQGLRRYGAEYLAWTEGSALRRTAEGRLQRVLTLHEAGEADAVDVLRARLELAIVGERLLDVQLRCQRSLVGLEGTAQNILVGDPRLRPEEAPVGGLNTDAP